MQETGRRRRPEGGGIGPQKEKGARPVYIPAPAQPLLRRDRPTLGKQAEPGVVAHEPSQMTAIAGPARQHRTIGLDLPLPYTFTHHDDYFQRGAGVLGHRLLCDRRSILRQLHRDKRFCPDGAL
jgi:hypothetical protein